MCVSLTIGIVTLESSRVFVFNSYMHYFFKTLNFYHRNYRLVVPLASPSLNIAELEFINLPRLFRQLFFIDERLSIELDLHFPDCNNGITQPKMF